MAAVPLTHDWSSGVWDWPLEQNDGVVRTVNTAEKFEVGLAVPYFTPNDIEVKVMGGELVVHCHHEERTEKHGTVTREIHRVYKLPSDVDTTTLKSHLNPNGVLVITANKK